MEKLLNESLQNQIKDILSVMINPITMVLFVSNDQISKETNGLLSEIADLSDKISLVTKDINKDHDLAKKYDITQAPSFVFLNHEGVYQGVKISGIPAGHEINSFISAIIDMSGAELGLDDETIKRIKAVDKPVNIKVFVTLSCPHCPGAVQKAHKIAMLNPNITGEAIDANQFQELAIKHQVSGVPKIVFNDRVELIGNQPLDQFLSSIEKA